MRQLTRHERTVLRNALCGYANYLRRQADKASTPESRNRLISDAAEYDDMRYLLANNTIVTIAKDPTVQTRLP